MSEDVSAVVVPIRLEQKGNITYISYGCNLGETCHCEYCRYSKAFREKQEKERAIISGENLISQ